MHRLAQASFRNLSAATTCCFVVAVLCASGGCRSSARNDVYIDKLAAEVRYLEDQLYQIDYENKVLREKLLRVKESELRSKPSPKKGLFGGSNKSTAPSKSSTQSKSIPGSSGLGPIQTPDTKLGQPVKTPAGETSLEDQAAPEIQLPDVSLPDIQPGDVSPPSEDQLVPPLIDPGELVPPGASSRAPVPRPNQVVLPASIQKPITEMTGSVDLRPPPAPANPTIDALVIDSNLSHALVDEQQNVVKGVHLVVKGLNQNGDTVPIDLPLKIAVLDPIRDGLRARLGIWQFDLEQLRQLHSYGVGAGVHVPIVWHEDEPLGESVRVYCRVERPDGERIQTEAIIDLSVRTGHVETWTPRSSYNLPNQ